MNNYDPARITIVFGSVVLRGFADGQFVSVEREEDGWSKNVGADGEVTRVRNRNQSGMVTVTLQQGSLANDELSAIAIEDDLLGTGTRALFLKDLNGNTVAEAPTAWIRKIPNVTYAKDAETREWVFDCDKINILVAGHVL